MFSKLCLPQINVPSVLQQLLRLKNAGILKRALQFKVAVCGGRVPVSRHATDGLQHIAFDVPATVHDAVIQVHANDFSEHQVVVAVLDILDQSAL